MKKRTLLTTTILTALAFQLSAQITITNENFPAWKTKADTNLISNDTSFALPTTGSDQKWEYVNSTKPEYGHFTDYFDMSSDPRFKDDITMHNHLIVFQAFKIDAYTHIGFDDKGFYEIGRTTDRIAFSLSALTGSPNDSLVFVKDVQEYNNRIDRIQFPATMNTTWEQDRIQYTHFSLSIGMFGLNKTPGYAKRYYTQKKEVVGSGTLQIPTSDNETSKPMDVLLIKVTHSNIDSFFVNDELAPKHITDAFGIYQGMVKEEITYEFYKEDYSAPILQYLGINGSKAKKLTYRPGAARKLSTSVYDLNSEKASAFPNPAVQGANISIQVPYAANAAEVTIYNVHGKLISTQTSTQINQDVFSFDLNGYSKGLYFYEVIYKNGSDKITGKFTVN